MKTRTALLTALAAAFAGLACDSVPPEAIEDCDSSYVVPLPVSTDILFVIDDSGSMAGEQATLQAGLDAFIQELASYAVQSDFQIGVTTTSVVDFGVADDGTSGGDLVSPPGVMVSSDPALVTKFQSAVVVGTSGYGREQPFTAARRAVEKSAAGGPNAGFLRAGAKLAIVFLSDEDDCSGATSLTTNAQCRTERTASPSALVPVAEFASYLRGPLEGEVRDLVVAAIVGVAPGSLDPACVTTSVCGGGPTPSCPTCCDTALDPGLRFVELLGLLGGGSTRLASICDDTFDQALSDIAGAIAGQTVPLDGAPADWRMLVASVDKPAMTVGCAIAPFDAPPGERAAADAIYEPPQAGRPASLIFQNACALEQGDRVNVRVICAG
jgi:hypothetical protein